ncbi:MAG: DUF2510 domain-containing protein [Ilumatobacteraceae bacterium]
MSTPANWYPDPTGRNEHRYWDGNAWTDHVSNRGVTGTDPVHAGPQQPLQAHPQQSRLDPSAVITEIDLQTGASVGTRATPH